MCTYLNHKPNLSDAKLKDLQLDALEACLKQQIPSNRTSANKLIN